MFAVESKMGVSHAPHQRAHGLSVGCLSHYFALPKSRDRGPSPRWPAPNGDLLPSGLDDVNSEWTLRMMNDMKHTSTAYNFTSFYQIERHRHNRQSFALQNQRKIQSPPHPSLQPTPTYKQHLHHNDTAMNIDEVMSDVPDAGTSSHGYVATKNSNSTPSGSGDDAPTWNTKKFRDECLNIRSRMLDSNFSFSVFLLAGLIRFFC